MLLKAFTSFASLLLLIVIPVYVPATEINYSVGATLAHYDNINLVQNPVRDEWSESLLATVDIVENTSNLLATVNAKFEAIDYQNNIIDDQNIGKLTAIGIWTLKPGRFQWFVSDVYAKTTVNTFGTRSLDNLQDANAFSTGPNITFRINSRNNLNLSGRLEMYTYEADLDNDRINFSSGWEYVLNNYSSFSLIYENETTQFDDELVNTDYDRDDLYFKYSYREGLNAIELEGGSVDITSDAFENANGTRLRLSLENQRTRTSSIRIEASRNISDTNDELLGLAGRDLDSIPETSSDVFIEHELRLDYLSELVFGSMQLGAFKLESEYETQFSRNQDETGYVVSVVWDLVRRSQVMLRHEYVNSFFENSAPQREDDDYLYGLAFSYNARRNVDLDLQLISQTRESNDPTASYEDFQVILSLVYSTK